MNILKYVFIVVIIIALGWVGFNILNKSTTHMSEEVRDSGIETVLLWSGIDTLPQWANNVSVETEGSSFSQKIVLTFTGEPQQVYAWFLDMSSMLKIQITGFFDPNVWHTYRLVPQSGAQSASLSLNKSLGQVRIEVSWS